MKQLDSWMLWQRACTEEGFPLFKLLNMQVIKV